MKYILDINDQIGGWWGISKQEVADVLDAHPEPANIRISSLGGAVDTALDIRQQLIDHGKITAYLYSMVASAATIIAMGASKIVMSKHSLFLIHQASTWTDLWGQMNKEQIEETIKALQEEKKTLETIDLTIASIYADKTGKSIGEIHDIMQKSEWLTADEAKDLGFVDEILEDSKTFQNSWEDIMADRVRRAKLPAVPAALMKTISPEPTLMDKLANFFNRNNGAPGSDANNDNKNTVMNSEFTKINALLNVEGVEFTDNQAAISHDQLQTIENRMSELEAGVASRDSQITDLQSQLSDRDNTIAELNAQIETLKKADGADEKHVNDEEKVTSATMREEAKSFLD